MKAILSAIESPAGRLSVGAAWGTGWRVTATCLRPQPSLRIPVTPANRECLRALRAAEAEAWETSSRKCAVIPSAAFGRQNLGGQRWA